MPRLAAKRPQPRRRRAGTRAVLELTPVEWPASKATRPFIAPSPALRAPPQRAAKRRAMEPDAAPPVRRVRSFVATCASLRGRPATTSARWGRIPATDCVFRRPRWRLAARPARSVRPHRSARPRVTATSAGWPATPGTTHVQARAPRTRIRRPAVHRAPPANHPRGAKPRVTAASAKRYVPPAHSCAWGPAFLRENPVLANVPPESTTAPAIAC